jgi:hypothetical protein
LFSGGFDRRPFLFTHKLHLHELLSIAAFKKLAAKMAAAERPRGYFWLSEESRGLKWGSSAFRKALNEGFDQIEVSRMRLKLSSIHLEPEYGELLAACTQELSELTSVDLSRAYRDPVATVFVTSPGEVTPYHVDHDANFLVQLYGTKTVNIFDGNDHELLPWRELEEYWHGARHIRLREEFQSRAIPFELRPGLGVHNPVNFPHWVKNGPLPSVSLAMSFTRVKHDPLDVLRMNRYLRRWGIEPAPPGKNAAIDSAKRAIIHAARSIKSALPHS